MPLHGRHRCEHSENVASFRTTYQEQCQNSYVCARRGLLSKIPGDDALDLFVDIIRADDWKPLLQALRLDKSLKVISFKSSFLSDYPEIVGKRGVTSSRPNPQFWMRGFYLTHI